MNVGALRHRITLENPGAAVADGDGGFTQAWTALASGTVAASVMPATARDLERVAGGTVISMASHLVTIRYLPGVTTKTRITKGPRNANGTLATGSREFSVVGPVNPEERNITLVLACVEVVP